MNEQVIVEKRGRRWIGELDGTDFVCDDNFEGDIPEGYIPLHEFLILSNPKQTKRETEISRKEIGFTKVYVYVEDSDDYWAYTNHKCNTCKKTCKQSHKVELLSCPQYEEV